MPTTKKVVFLILWFFLTSSHAALREEALAVWVNEAIVATYTYNHKQFVDDQKAIAKYFTAESWINYSNALQKSNLPETIQKNQYRVRAVAMNPPEIKEQRPGHWQATMPLLVVYKNPQYQQKQTLEVTISFMQVPSNQGVRGLAITSLKSKVIKPACRCDNVDSGD